MMEPMSTGHSKDETLRMAPCPYYSSVCLLFMSQCGSCCCLVFLHTIQIAWFSFMISQCLAGAWFGREKYKRRQIPPSRISHLRTLNQTLYHNISNFFSISLCLCFKP
ncbi:hypothetical protein BDR26DRAFT_386132 [Obelidium mucronatum]|nr:hypothetical protein BDR26DRAFT_386132 [Obelidium mucronatum]